MSSTSSITFKSAKLKGGNVQRLVITYATEKTLQQHQRNCYVAMLCVSHPTILKKPTLDSEHGPHYSNISPLPNTLRSQLFNLKDKFQLFLELYNKHCVFVLMSSLHFLHEKNLLLTHLTPDCICLQITDTVINPFLFDVSSSTFRRTGFKQRDDYNVYHAPETHFFGELTPASNTYTLGLINTCVCQKLFVEDWKLDDIQNASLVQEHALQKAVDNQKPLLALDPFHRMPLPLAMQLMNVADKLELPPPNDTDKTLQLLKSNTTLFQGLAQMLAQVKNAVDSNDANALTSVKCMAPPFLTIVLSCLDIHNGTFVEQLSAADVLSNVSELIILFVKMNAFAQLTENEINKSQLSDLCLLVLNEPTLSEQNIEFINAIVELTKLNLLVVNDTFVKVVLNIDHMSMEAIENVIDVAQDTDFKRTHLSFREKTKRKLVTLQEQNKTLEERWKKIKSAFVNMKELCADE